MPVEIKELIIKATVSSDGDKTADKLGNNDLDKNEIIKTCVEEVLDILERTKER